VVGTRATFRERREQRPVDFTVGVDEYGIPNTSYAAVDPALIPALESLNGFDPPDPLRVIAVGVPPIGVYLPGTGNSQFKLPPPTPTPAVSPLPTSTRFPLPLPEGSLPPGFNADMAAGIPPTFTPAVNRTDNCAPAGWPVAGNLTQYYQWYHRGIDLGIPLGTGVVATHSGVVLFAGWRTDGYGNLIIVQSGIFITYYGHLPDFNVVTGQPVTRGSVIGLSGSTGNSTGPHVHYEIRINDVEVDPLTFENRGYPTC
ncbi:MAG: hypothetical protein EHM39_03655, partial [Chloroflexi bacterium]